MMIQTWKEGNVFRADILFCILPVMVNQGFCHARTFTGYKVTEELHHRLVKTFPYFRKTHGQIHHLSPHKACLYALVGIYSIGKSYSSEYQEKIHRIFTDIPHYSLFQQNISAYLSKEPQRSNVVCYQKNLKKSFSLFTSFTPSNFHLFSWGFFIFFYIFCIHHFFHYYYYYIQPIDPKNLNVKGDRELVRWAVGMHLVFLSEAKPCT